MTVLKNISVLVIFLNAIIVCSCQQRYGNYKISSAISKSGLPKNSQGVMQSKYSGSYAYTDENGELQKVDIPETVHTVPIRRRDLYEAHPLFRQRRLDAYMEPYTILFRRTRQVPGVPVSSAGTQIGDLQGLSQLVRFKNYKFAGRKRLNPEQLFPGAVIGDGVSQPIGSFAGIGYLGESDLSGLAPTIYDRLPMPNLFQTSYPGLIPGMDAEAQAAASDSGTDGNDLDSESDTDKR